MEGLPPIVGAAKINDKLSVTPVFEWRFYFDIEKLFL
jgi:hypothetical protein